MKQRLIVGNWKMHLTTAQGIHLVKQMHESLVPSRSVEVVVCPSFMALSATREMLNRKLLKLGAQNCHFADQGPSTGEVAASQLRGLVDYVIVGHSERRMQFDEDDRQIAKKVASVCRNGMTPILCVGESLVEREGDLTRKVVVDQVAAGLSLLTASDIPNLVIAYEPIWAIGTGEVAMPDQVAPVIAAIRRMVEELYGESSSADLTILYGGSVTSGNAKAYLGVEGIDGLLVGGASLKAHEFTAIAAAAHK